MDKNNPLKIIFAGTPEFAVPALQALLNSRHKVCAVFTQPDRPAGRGQKLHASPIKLLAQQYKIPVHQPVTLRDANVQKEIVDYQADVMIVVAYGLILPQAVLNIPHLGCINVHASLLPRWRGAAPIQRAILAGDTKTGVTIMQMDAGLDTGDYYLQKSCNIAQDVTAQTLHDKLAKLGSEILLTTLDQLQNKTATANPQDNSAATYATKLNKQEAAIQWHQSADEIDRAIRAFNPWPVAYSQLGEKNVRVWAASVLENTANTNTIANVNVNVNANIIIVPGTIIETSKMGIDVATGNGILRLEILQLPGGKPLSAKDLLNAHAQEFAVGKQFQNPVQ